MKTAGMMLNIVMLLMASVLSYSQVIDHDECIVAYNEQPPVELPCNPYRTYLDPPEPFFRYGCGVETSAELENLDLTFYRELADGTIEDLGCDIEVSHTPTTRRCLIDIVGGTAYPSSYWCKASYTVNGVQQTLRTSDVARLREPSNYTGLAEVCQSTISEQNVFKCADIPQQTKSSSINEATTSTMGSEIIQTTRTIHASSSITTTAIGSSNSGSGVTTIQAELLSLWSTVLPAESNTKPIRTSIQGSSTSQYNTKLQTSQQMLQNTQTAIPPQETSDTLTNHIPLHTAMATPPPSNTANDSFLRSEIMVIALLAVCSVLLIALVITLTILIVVLTASRRRIKHIRRFETRNLNHNEALSPNKPNDRTEDLEGSTGTLMQEKYVYPTPATLDGIYSIPSQRKESLENSKTSSHDSGHASQESYQTLMSTNMEYTSIYTIPTGGSSSIRGYPKATVRTTENL